MSGMQTRADGGTVAWSPEPRVIVAERPPGGPVKGPDSRAGRTVAILVGLNLVAQIALVVVAVASDMDVVTSVRLSLVVGLFLYAASALWVVTRARSSDVRPSLGLDTALVGAAEGFIVGGGAALLMVAVVRLVLGDPLLDPTAALLAADGALGPLLLGVLVIVLVAPLVEELIFRGFLAEAFRSKGRWEAIIVSAIAFGLVHLRPAQFRYYVFLGVALAVVYLRRGLVGSVCAHAAFNGMLVLVALSATNGPVVEAEGAGARITLPPAWSTARGFAGLDLVAEGPAGAHVELAHLDVPAELRSPELVARALVSGSVPLPERVSTDAARVTVIDLPAGRAVSAEATVRGDDGRVVMLPKGGRLWVVVMGSGGSARDSRDFDAMLQSWRLP